MQTGRIILFACIGTVAIVGLAQAQTPAYKAAQSKNQDNILMASDTLTTACANCHEKYRDKPTLADRCK